MGGKKSELVLRLSDPGAQLQARARRARPSFQVPGLGVAPVPAAPASGSGLTLDGLLALSSELLEAGDAEAAEAVGAVLSWRQNQARLGFLRPLLRSCQKGEDSQEDGKREWRVHARLNLNTATGRLSSRSPNLQGEPTKSHAVRSVLAAPAGRRLLVADYGQLELRLVAHLANCEAMIKVLTHGGDIHSRTAYRMFEEVQRAVDAGEVVLDDCSGATPSVKERYSELRKRAKTLNFALLYGKTVGASCSSKSLKRLLFRSPASDREAYSLANDWGLEKGEAQGLIDRWKAAFPDISRWMSALHSEVGNQDAHAVTLLGRRRPLPKPATLKELGRTQRVAGNTPVQGSAADVVLSAMLEVERSKRLQALGYRLVLQIHDELVGGQTYQ